MSTVFAGEHDVVTELIRRRQELGQDLFDEVWNGVYHVAPNAATEHGEVVAEIIGALRSEARRAKLRVSSAFNLGGKDDFRVPDAGWFRTALTGSYAPSAVAVLEVLSPGDETYRKFSFYAEHGVQEILVAHPLERWVECWARDEAWLKVPDSSVFGMPISALVAEIAWP